MVYAHLLILHHGLHLWEKKGGIRPLRVTEIPNGSGEDVLGRRPTLAATMQPVWPWLAGLASALPAFPLSPAFLLQAVYTFLFCSQKEWEGRLSPFGTVSSVSLR